MDQLTAIQLGADYQRCLYRTEQRRPLTPLIDQTKLSSVEQLRLFIDGFKVERVCNVCRIALMGRPHLNCDRFLESKR